MNDHQKKVTSEQGFEPQILRSANKIGSFNLIPKAMYSTYITGNYFKLVKIVKFHTLKIIHCNKAKKHEAILNSASLTGLSR